MAAISKEKFLSLGSVKDKSGFTTKYNEDPLVLDPRNKELGGRLIINLEKLNLTVKKLKLDYKKYVIQDERFMRAEELPYLRGDAGKLRETFGWEPEYTFEMLMDEMIEHWEKIYN